MGYQVLATCDDCGCGLEWNDVSVSQTAAKNELQAIGFVLRKDRWLCQDCAKKDADYKRWLRDPLPTKMWSDGIWEATFGGKNQTIIINGEAGCESENGNA